MLWYNFWPSWRLIALPALIAVAFAAAMGAGLWISALNVKYRDFRSIVPFIVRELLKTPYRRDESHPRNSRKNLANLVAPFIYFIEKDSKCPCFYLSGTRPQSRSTELGTFGTNVPHCPIYPFCAHKFQSVTESHVIEYYATAYDVDDDVRFTDF